MDGYAVDPDPRLTNRADRAGMQPGLDCESALAAANFGGDSADGGAAVPAASRVTAVHDGVGRSCSPHKSDLELHRGRIWCQPDSARYRLPTSNSKTPLERDTK